MERRLAESTINKISKFDISRPYIWELKLSEDEFRDIESYLQDLVSCFGIATLSNPENAILTIAYIAEWYKRRYISGNNNTIIDGLNLEALWTNSGISQRQYLYRDSSGNKRWLYSLYILGGLAIHHENNRNDSMKFLKGLCRIYNGEEYTLENLDDQTRAVAFRESINQHHSLYEYLKTILNGEMPFDASDLNNPLSEINQFIEKIKIANEEILKKKFRFEWKVTFSPEYAYMTRRLMVWLKPEGEKASLHQYLRYDRLHIWGIQNPEKHNKLFLHIRFRNGSDIVEGSTMEKPIITYLNHSVNDFVAFGIEKGVLVKDIPCKPFTNIELIIKDEFGNEYIAQSESTKEYLQLWRENGYGDLWSSAQNAQLQTALIFSNKCLLNNPVLNNECIRQRFNSKVYGTTETWNWIHIYDKISFTDEKGNQIDLYNRIGYDQITTKLYSNTINYVEGGKIKYNYIDDPNISEEIDTELLPVIFGYDDIIVRHFATKDDIIHAQPEKDSEIEKIRFQKDTGKYDEWTDTCAPEYGIITLKVFAKGKEHLLRTVYLPSYDISSPIKRDFDTCSIIYRNFDENVIQLEDQIPFDGKVLDPTIEVKLGGVDSYATLEVFRPTLIKEVIFDGRIIKYLDKSDVLKLPYIFKERVCIHDFSTNGYQAYECKNINNIYTEDYLNVSGNPSVGMAALSCWDRNQKFKGKLLDILAPDCLEICFGNSKSCREWDNQRFLFWNYERNIQPCECTSTEITEFGLIFQDLSKNKDLTCNFPILNDDDPWAFEDIDYCILNCFEVANERGTYFFLMRPLLDLRKEKIVDELLLPLLNKRNGKLNKEDQSGLIRFCYEFGLNWEDYKKHIENA